MAHRRALIRSVRLPSACLPWQDQLALPPPLSILAWPDQRGDEHTQC
jgi:hypothetical protein